MDDGNALLGVLRDDFCRNEERRERKGTGRCQLESEVDPPKGLKYKLELTSCVLDPNRTSSDDDNGVLGVLESLLSLDEWLFCLSKSASESPHWKVVGRSESEDRDLEDGNKY